ncbi:putative drug antiporter protein precursor [Actinoplanes cyaneus]|uniref:Drug antiporter protein n=1 Tax=Actinoplanes cyaneus TaxID=52696 RepID=A0A919ID94_9ACTN|nr:MFS transporter [Actinoplanes cyaneus]MCW2137398.1 Transmembrane secretion effector [Actinoplanes cyaneus]GID63449.1 putative drug antiporter protein precursor [Actinoplanes cyaneus]
MRRGLAGLLAAEAISLLGSRITFVALPWLVLTSTGSALMAGVAGFAEMLPYVLAGLLGGPIVDRVGPRSTAVAADVASLLAVSGIPLMVTTENVSYHTLLGLIALAGALRGFGDTAKRALLPRVIADAGLSTERGTTLYDGISRVATLLGLPLAGLLVAAVGPARVLLVDAASFGVCALLISIYVRTAPTAPGPAEEDEGGYAAALRCGFRYVRQDRLIIGIMSLLFATNLFDQAFATVFVPVWVREGPHGPAALGVLGSAFGIGAVAGNILWTIVGPRLPRRGTFAVCFVIGGPAQLFALALSDRLWLVLTVAAMAGALMSTINPILLAAVYERIPVRVQGRVMSVLIAFSWAGIPLGGVLGGWAADELGLRTGALLAGIGYLAVTLAPFVFPAWHSLDEHRSRETRTKTLVGAK